MKKRLLSLLLMLILCLPWAQADTPVTTTVMVYMCGSNLESQYGLATHDINEMIQARFTPRITNVVLMTGGSSDWVSDKFDPEQSGIYQLRGSSPVPLAEGPSLNMGQSDTLSYFLNTAYEKCPADRYILIFWNHGGGPIKGVCWDENYGKDSLMIPELIQGLENSPFAERKLDLIGFDACLMGSVETAWQLSDYAHYMVASEETEPGSGWNYSFLKGMEYDVSPADTARRIVDLYIDSADPAQGYHMTLSCIDLNKIQAVISSMNTFFTDLNTLMNADMFLDMSNLRHYAQGFGRDFRAEESADYDLVDMTSLLDSFDKYQLASGANLRAALKEAIVYSRSTHDNSHGLSVYFPYFNLGSYSANALTLYRQLDFCPGYTDYIQSFQAFMTGESAVDWQGLTPVVTREEEGFGVSLHLTEAQKNNLVSAKLVIFESSFMPGSANAFYSRVYGSTNVAISEDGCIAAPYNDECMIINYTTDLGVDTFSDAIPFMLLDSGEYRIQVMAANIKSGYLSSAKDDEPGVSHLMQITLSPPDENGLMHLSTVQGYDSMTESFTSRMDDAPENYQYLHFVTRPSLATRKDGLLLPFEMWLDETADGQTLYENFPVPTGSDLSFQFRQEAHGQRYAAFEITDSFNNVFTTELTAIRPLEEFTLYQRTFSLPDPQLDVNCRVIAVNDYELLLLIEVVNHTAADYSFRLCDLNANGKAWEISDSAAGTWRIPAGQKSSIHLSYGLNLIPKYGSEMRSCSFSLELNDAAGMLLGTLNGLSINPGVDLRTLPAFFR